MGLTLRSVGRGGTASPPRPMLLPLSPPLPILVGGTGRGRLAEGRRRRSLPLLGLGFLLLLSFLGFLLFPQLFVLYLPFPFSFPPFHA